MAIIDRLYLGNELCNTESYTTRIVIILFSGLFILSTVSFSNNVHVASNVSFISVYRSKMLSCGKTREGVGRGAVESVPLHFNYETAICVHFVLLPTKKNCKLHVSL